MKRIVIVLVAVLSVIGMLSLLTTNNDIAGAVVLAPLEKTPQQSYAANSLTDVAASQFAELSGSDASPNADHKDDTDFDFTPYVSKEMADEIRPYTSRKSSDLEVKLDASGREYVDLKKRWSHATISVVDENGVKHTGEWAPK
jgi:hypothetical protein